MSRAKDYRKHAKEARVYAEHLTGAREKAMSQQIAEEWDRMADKADALPEQQLAIEHEVRRRAYELWEQYGRPETGADEFWLKAEREIMKEKREGTGRSRGRIGAPSGPRGTA